MLFLEKVRKPVSSKNIFQKKGNFIYLRIWVLNTGVRKKFTPFLVTIPTIAGPINPGVVAIALDIPMIIPPWRCPTSKAFTITALKANPKKNTPAHWAAMVACDESKYPDIIRNIPEHVTPKRKY